MLCDECVGKLVAQKRGNPRRKKASETHHHHHHYHRQGPSTPGGPSPEALLQQALLLLGLQQGATWEQVQAAYKAAAVANHPDKYQGAQREQAEARLKNINAAYEVLKGHYKRAA
jgi:predicted transcriptional regulator